jgi:hypothetical protein
MGCLVKHSIATGGVRQGDPLSPLLFVVAADFLQSMLNKGKELGLIRLPIPIISAPEFLLCSMQMTL